MRRFIAVLSGLLVLPAFAEVAPVYYEELVEYTDEMLTDEESDAKTQESNVQQPNVVQRNTINRSTSASRAVSSATNSVSSRTNTSSRAVASSPRTSANTSRTTRTTKVVNRPSSTVSRASVTARGTQNTKPVTARVGTAGNAVMNETNRVLRENQTNIVEDSGKILYNPNNAARTSVATRRSSNSARLPIAVSSDPTPVITEADVSSTTSALTAVAELTDYCKAQYAACMDTYCNVLDDNQGRCSCSKNLKNYAKTEEALEAATEQFQEAIQKIRYIGLTGPQIEALFEETEAELAMRSNSDSSQLKSSLDAIKKSVIDVPSTSASSASNVTNGLSLDLNGLLNADFTAGFDLNSFLGVANTTNATNVSNQRGEQLYKTATNRCRTTVLNSCIAQGIDPNMITNSYDLEIDKQCIAYERTLTEANTVMKNNVFNATNILQQARLLLTQNKNSYDLRGCVAAIDSCMQDEYVCGTDYELCLDPTGKYLANGEVIKGGTPGVVGGQSVNQMPITSTTQTLDDWTSGGMYNLYATWNYSEKGTGSTSITKNAWSVGKGENVGGYIDAALATWEKNYKQLTDSTKSNNLALSLLQKIGYIDDDDKVHGMCASAMKQCQDYTFDSKKSNHSFIPDNEVVRQYLNNTLAKIKVKQDALLSDYAEGCRSDVQSCLATNGYDETNTTSTVSKTAVNACSAEIATCMSVGGYQANDGAKLTLRAMTDWVAAILINCPAGTYLQDDGESGNVTCKSCPANSTSSGGQAQTCTCNEGYTAIADNNGVVTSCTQPSSTGE